MHLEICFLRCPPRIIGLEVLPCVVVPAVFPHNEVCILVSIVNSLKTEVPPGASDLPVSPLVAPQTASESPFPVTSCSQIDQKSLPLWEGISSFRLPSSAPTQLLFLWSSCCCALNTFIHSQMCRTLDSVLLLSVGFFFFFPILVLCCFCETGTVRQHDNSKIVE